MLQTFPAIVIGLYSRWFHRWALLAGWAVAMVYGTLTAYGNPKVGKPDSHFGSPLNEFPFTDTLFYIGFTALVVNLVVAVLGTLLLRALSVPEGVDATSPQDYGADLGDEGVEAELTPETAAH
jgi:SSS family solute:Na+ symporter